MYKIGSFVVLYIFSLCTVTADDNLRVIEVNIGQNLTIPCPIQERQANDVVWKREGRDGFHHMSVLNNGSLFLYEVDQNDSAIYSCNRENVVNPEVKARIKVEVKTPPLALNITIKPSTILALLIWEIVGNGGYPIISFTAQYRLAQVNESWIPISPNHIMPNCRQIEVYKLVPNTTYQFRIWATNQLGRGEITEKYVTTLDIYNEQELARHLLDGADKFDTRIWAVAVGIVMGTLILLGLGTCFLLYQECRVPGVMEEQEIIELVPNIILNPGFDPNSNNDQMPDENSNSETPLRLNNNTVVQPNHA